ncbi:MAG: hypothetical protein HND58_18430 [Planctomycetota bacterium]|nr:MAG: hypothetical protein HND58_18430 [Planctomycetota bacterium]
MTITACQSRRPMLPLVLAAVSAAALAPVAHAQNQTYTYELQNVWLQPDSGQSARQLVGTFTWTFSPGDFENGRGVCTELSVPWGGYAADDLNITIETGGFETSLMGNWHDRGCDINLKFVEDLSPDQPSTIDLELSSFDIQYGVSYQGRPSSGSIVRVFPDCPGDFNSDGAVNTQDILAFLNAWTAGDEAADFNEDGSVNTLDVLAFLNVWTGGC